MNPKVDDFPALIHWIAEKYHGGAVHPIHEKVGISPALVQLWSKGGVKNPSLESLISQHLFQAALVTEIQQATRKPLASAPVRGRTPSLGPPSPAQRVALRAARRTRRPPC